MGREIERKFLIRDDSWKNLAQGILYRQGYLNNSRECTVRVRVVGHQGFVTIKGPTLGASRSEFEYPIPVGDANEILTTLCQRPLIEKMRHKIPHAGLTWEVDEFLGENQGLIIAEVELCDEQQKVPLPAWIGTEVTSDPRYFNSNLVKNPFSKWERKV